MFRWLQAMLTMTILMAVAFLIVRLASDLYDEYNSSGVLTLIGGLFFLLCVLAATEGLWGRWRRRIVKRDQ
jgi:uncharacterized membrane protein